MASAAYAEQLMIDPSLLVDRVGIDALRASRRESSTVFLIPGSLYRAIREGEDWELLLEEYPALEAASIDEARSLLSDDIVHPFVPADVEPRDDVVYPTLLDAARGQRLLADAWYLEWVFLNTQSWIAAASRRTFEAFKQAGAIAVEMPRQVFDAVARRTPHVIPAAAAHGLQPPAALTATQRLRAVAKWIATGGPPWAFFLNPIIGAFAGTAAGIFLLFDP